jgi:hypothetical protein
MTYDRRQYNERVASAIKRLAALRRADPAKYDIYTRQINSLREASSMPSQYSETIRQIMGEK